jgi:hypothetical protein
MLHLLETHVLRSLSRGTLAVATGIRVVIACFWGHAKVYFCNAY